MRSFPFIVNQDSSGQELELVDTQIRAYNEAWLQELIRKHPNILPTSEIEPVFFPLVPIGCEVTITTGSIDNLYISHRGYLVLAETKLWKNPQAKREVVAQTIEYGSSIAKWDYSRLDEVVRAYTKKYEHKEYSLIDWVEHRCGPVEGGHEYFEETVYKNLSLGRFLTIIVGDKIRPSIVEMLEHANKTPHLANDVVLIELHCYRNPNQKANWPLFVIPSIVAQTQIVERSIVEISVSQTGITDIKSKQVKEDSKGKGRKRGTLTEEAFWDRLKSESPASYDEMKCLIDYYRKLDGIDIYPAESSIVVKLGIQNTGFQASLFIADIRATLQIWPNTVGDQLEKAGFDRNLVKDYREKIRGICRMGKNRKEFGRPISNVNIKDFISAVDEFIQKLQAADPVD